MSEAAAVAVVVAVVSAVIGPLVVAKANERAKRIEAALGTPNGHGDIVHMMEKLLHGQTGQDARLAAIEARMSKGDDRMIRLGTRLSTQGDQLDSLSRRVGRIETSCQFIAHHVEETTAGE